MEDSNEDLAVLELPLRCDGVEGELNDLPDYKGESDFNVTFSENGVGEGRG